MRPRKPAQAGPAGPAPPSHLFTRARESPSAPKSVKRYLDALTGIAYADDRQLGHLLVRRFALDRPHARRSARDQAAQAAIQEHLANRVSNHGAKGIAATVGRMGETIDWSLLDTSMTPHLRLAGVKDNPAALLDAWTQRRHQLVHHGEALKIGSPAAHALADFVVEIARIVDGIAVSATK